MSMNIDIWGTREVVVTKTGAKDTQTCQFDCWQTPTTVTRAILATSDPIQAYKDWVLSRSCPIEEPVFAEDDFFQDRDPIGVEIVHPGVDHCAELDEWLVACKQAGYEIVCDEI